MATSIKICCNCGCLYVDAACPNCGWSGWNGWEDEEYGTEKRYGYWVQGDYYDMGDVCSECGYDSGELCPMIPICPCCGAEMFLEDE